MTSPAAYNAHVLADGPLLYWPMDEAAGTTVNDLSGGGFDGTYLGGPLLGQPGPLACADPTDFAPVFSELVGPNAAQMAWRALSPFSGTGDFTFEHWIRPDPGTALLPFVCTLQQRDGVINATLFRFAAHTGVGRVQTQTVERITWPGYVDRLGCWSYVAITRVGTTLSLYVNGDLIGTAVDPSTDIAPNNLSAGADWVDTFVNYTSDAEKEQLRGQVCKVAIFDHHIGATRIAERAALGCTGCGAHWIVGPGPIGTPEVDGWQ